MKIILYNSGVVGSATYSASKFAIQVSMLLDKYYFSFACVCNVIDHVDDVMASDEQKAGHPDFFFTRPQCITLQTHAK